MKKPIYSAPIVDQIKDLQRACEMALDLLDTIPLKHITAQDMRRTGLREGEFALCDWVVRPRFVENAQYCCSEGETYPATITFQDWWNSLARVGHGSQNRSVGTWPAKSFEISEDVAKAVWKSLGMSVED